MALMNLLEYGKLGMGAVFAVAGTSHVLGASTTKAAMEEAMYRTLTVVNPETLVNAKMSLDSYIFNMHSNDPLLTAGCIFIGSAVVASAIYNLVKNYREESKQ